MRLTIFIFFTFCCNIAFGQYYGNYEINFDDSLIIENLFIDTVSNPDNIWEIGSPHKSNFDSAYSYPNAICTDLNSLYPINDTSAFYIKNLADGGFEYHHTVILAGKYKIDTDTLKDFGRIEFSPDNGNTWVDLLTDTVYREKGCYEWWSEKPILTGRTSEWKEFYVWLAGFGREFNIGGWESNDTVIYKFLFISDSIRTNRSGWIIDNLHFQDYWESIDEKKFNTFQSFAYPNPAFDYVNIQFANDKEGVYNITIYDFNGRVIKNIRNQSGLLKTNLNDFKPGIYLYKIQNENEISIGKIIKQ